MRTSVSVWLLVTALTGQAWAMEPIPGEERFAGVVQDDQHHAGAEVAIAQIEGDFFVALTPRFDLNFGKLGVGLQVPLNLRLNGDSSKDFYGVIRHEDWNEPSEFFKMIRYVRWGQKRDPVHVRVGELAAEIGHGTIMSRYMNNLDLNTFRLGLQLDVNTDYGGAETIVGDFGSLVTTTPESRVLGTRGYFKPLSLMDPEHALNIFAVGVTAITDINAPLTLATNSAGVPESKGGNLVVASHTAATVYGFDIEAAVLQTDIINLIPYIDLNFIHRGGWGLHIGAQARVSLALGFDLSMPMRLEYRRFRNDYVPAYFSTFYELERYTYPLGHGGAVTPKSWFVREVAADSGGLNGYYGDLALNFAGIIALGGIYEDDDRSDPNVAVFLSVPALSWLQFKAYYARSGVGGLGDLFTLDERSMAVAQARYQIVSYLYLVARWSRRWALDTNTGTYKPEDAWKAGAEVSFSF